MQGELGTISLLLLGLNFTPRVPPWGNSYSTLRLWTPSVFLAHRGFSFLLSFSEVQEGCNSSVASVWNSSVHKVNQKVGKQRVLTTLCKWRHRGTKGSDWRAKGTWLVNNWTSRNQPKHASETHRVPSTGFVRSGILRVVPSLPRMLPFPPGF